MINPALLRTWLTLILIQTVFATTANQSAGSVDLPDPIAFFPLNGEYKTKDVNNSQLEGKPSNVHLAAGPDGAPNGSFYFMGIEDSYIEFPNNGSLDTKTSITILLWLYPENDNGPLFDYNAASQPFAVHFWLRYGYLISRFASLGPDSQSTPVASSKPVKPKQWQFVGVTYSQKSGTVQFWMDGQPDKSYNIGKIDRLASVGNVRIGVIPGDFELYLKGRIAQVRVFDVPLTAEQVKSIADNTQAVDICAEQKPCQNAAECEMTAPDQYICKCTDEFEGKNCENGVDICAKQNPCKNGAECENKEGGFSCKCKEGFQGKNCEKEINGCDFAEVNCFNGGSCEARGSSYTCNCADGYIGTHCEWAVKGCFKEWKKVKKKAMPKVFKTVQGNTKSVEWVVQECMRQADKDGLEVFGVRKGVQCVTTNGRHYSVHGRSNGCQVVGQYGVGNKKANFVYMLYKNSD
ncbi:uncharacterized protein LOC144654348 [Oculina patagonica]